MAATTDYTLAELCITAPAEAWRHAGEVPAAGPGPGPPLAAGHARLTFSPDLQMTDAESLLVAEPVPVGKRDGYQLQVEGWMPFRKVFEVLWSGRRHAMTMPTQIDRFGAINISYIGGTFEKPKVQLLGVRGIPGNTINHPCSFFVVDHSKRSFVERVDMASGAGYDPARWQPGVRRDFHRLGLVVTNLAVLDFGGPDHAMRLRSLHPGVTAEQVEAATSFPLVRAADLHETAAPTAEQLRLIRTVLDPHDLRATVFK